MRRWLAMLIGTAAIAFAGTALAMAGYGDNVEKEAATDTTVVVKDTVTTLEEPDRDEIVSEDQSESVEKPHEYDVPELDPIDRGPIDDTTPPEIVILHPEDGQVFERREIAFEGETEPGTRVFVGDKEADVSDGGAWRIVLALKPGKNVITVKAVDSSENVGSDTVTVTYLAPEKDEPKEEPKDEPKEEPKEEEPKEEEPAVWEFSAHQVFGECSESPPYDVFHGTGKPGSVIHIESEYGGGVTEVGEDGGWEIKVFFEGAPIGQVFAVHVRDGYEHHKVFEFVHTD